MSNSSARHQLEILYGKGCMFRKAQIAKRIEEMGGIKTYKQFVKETKYKRKKIQVLENKMTYHHLQHKSKGGKTDVANGSIVGELPHRYIHSLPQEQEEIVNNMLQNFKYDIGMGIIIAKDLELEVIKTKIVETSLDTENDLFTIPVYENSIEENLKAYNRAKEKEELRKQLQEYYKYRKEEDNER